jgi:hypothetical protein
MTPRSNDLRSGSRALVQPRLLETHTTTDSVQTPITHKHTREQNAEGTSCFQEIEIIIKPKKKPNCRKKGENIE